MTVPLSCFAERGADFGGIDVPFSIAADAPFAASFTNIKVVAGAGEDADALDCRPTPTDRRPVGAASAASF